MKQSRNNMVLILKLMSITLILMIIDQFIKYIIHSNFMDKTFCVIKEHIYIKPILNPDLWWFNVKYGWDVGSEFIVLITLIILVVFVTIGIKYLNNRYEKDSIIVIGYVIFMAGIFSSLVDRVVWGTSLDYIYIYNRIVLDLKDIYITIGEYTLIGGYIVAELRKYIKSYNSYKRELK